MLKKQFLNLKKRKNVAKNQHAVALGKLGGKASVSKKKGIHSPSYKAKKRNKKTTQTKLFDRNK